MHLKHKLKLENLAIALGVILTTIPASLSLYSGFNQNLARNQWEQVIVKADATVAIDQNKGEATGVDPSGLVERPPKPGESAALLEIPALDKKYDVIEGEAWGNLAKGPIRLTSSSPVGANGSTVISGHRTMYGAPFRHIDELSEGDVLRVYTKRAVFVYRVVETKIVKPSDMTDVSTDGAPRLILSTCDPVFSAKHRLLIISKLVTANPLR